jgi:hypothetical protein
MIMADVKSQHVTFSYEALPELFHNDPRSFLTYLRRDKLNFLRFWWDYVGKNAGAKEQVSSEGLDFSIRELENGVTLTLITLPAPTHPKEAYYLAMVLPKPKGGLFVRKDLTRIFTLENKLDAEGNPKLVVGEITPRLKHVEFAKATDSSLDSFSAAVVEIIKSYKL